MSTSRKATDEFSARPFVKLNEVFSSIVRKPVPRLGEVFSNLVEWTVAENRRGADASSENLSRR